MSSETRKISGSDIRLETKSLVVCHQCGKVLYQMPVTEVTGVYRRVALNTIEGHSQAFFGHEPEIIFVDRKTNEKYEQMGRLAEIMSNVYGDSIM